MEASSRPSAMSPSRTPSMFLSATPSRFSPMFSFTSTLTTPPTFLTLSFSVVFPLIPPFGRPYMPTASTPSMGKFLPSYSFFKIFYVFFNPFILKSSTI